MSQLLPREISPPSIEIQETSITLPNLWHLRVAWLSVPRYPHWNKRSFVLRLSDQGRNFHVYWASSGIFFDTINSHFSRLFQPSSRSVSDFFGVLQSAVHFPFLR